MLSSNTRHILTGAAGLGLGYALGQSDLPRKTQRNNQRPHDICGQPATTQRAWHNPNPQRLSAPKAPQQATPPPPKHTWLKQAQADVRRIEAVEQALGYNLAHTELQASPTGEMTFDALSKLANAAEETLSARQTRWKQLEYDLRVLEHNAWLNECPELVNVSQVQKVACQLENQAPPWL